MNEFRKEDKKVLINVPYAEAYLPVSLFSDNEKEKTSSSMAVFSGDGIQVLGFFYMRFFDSEDDATQRENYKLRTFAYPNKIETHPSDFEKMNLTLEGRTELYYVCKYYMDDVMMDMFNEKSVLNCEFYLDSFVKAKFPKSIGYQDILLNWLKNFQINDIDPGVKAIHLQIIIAENVRWVKDPTKPYRIYAATADSINPSDYVTYNMNNVAANNSVLNGLGFEHVSDKIGTGLMMSMKNIKQNVSPLEKVMLM